MSRISQGIAFNLLSNFGGPNSRNSSSLLSWQYWKAHTVKIIKERVKYKLHITADCGGLLLWIIGVLGIKIWHFISRQEPILVLLVRNVGLFSLKHHKFKVKSFKMLISKFGDTDYFSTLYKKGLGRSMLGEDMFRTYLVHTSEFLFYKTPQMPFVWWIL